MEPLLIALVGILLLVGLPGVMLYNRGIKLRNMEREAWSGVEVQLQRRHDLVPNLVETVKGYQRHERGLLESLTRQRTEAVAARSAEEANQREKPLVDGMRQLFALAEAYPDLKADGNFRKLSASLVEIEDDLQYARRYYNGVIRDFRNYAESFPSNLVASTAGFRPGAFFEVEDSTVRNAVQIDLS